MTIPFSKLLICVKLLATTDAFVIHHNINRLLSKANKGIQSSSSSPLLSRNDKRFLTINKKNDNPRIKKILKASSASSEPNESEIIQQQKETYKSLQDYHYGTWVGTSKSFTLQPSDTTANSVATIKDYVESNNEYTTSMNIIQNNDGNSYGKIQETISWNNQEHTMVRATCY